MSSGKKSFGKKSFGKKCKELFDRAAETVKDALAPPPQPQPIPVRADRPRQQRWR